MRWPAAGLFAAGLAMVLAWLPPAAAQQLAAAVPPLVLADEAQQVDARAHARTWLDPQGQAGPGDAVRAADAFQPAQPQRSWQLGPQAALWLHLRLQRATGQRQDWMLELPMPVLDHVTVYQWDGTRWRAESAGDTVPVALWPERGRSPFFRLDLPPGEVRDVLVRVRHAAAATFPLDLSTAGQHSHAVQREYLGLGVAFGAMLLLIAASFARGWVYRDPVFAWYAAYAALASLAVAAYTGVANHLLWPERAALADAPTPMLAAAAVGAGVLFVRDILGLRRRLAVQDALMGVLGFAGLLLALLPAFTPKAIHLPVVGGYMSLASIVALLLAGAAWRRGDAVARWVFFAQLPMVAALLATVSGMLGWSGIASVPQYAVVVGLAVEVPLMLVGLFIRSRERHSAEVREQALSTQDALTGLLPPHLFSDRLRQVVARHRRDGEAAAVMYIDLVNHRPIREALGAAVAEQSLLRSVIKLRRLLRDVDTVARVGEARFAVLLEGASSRGSVTERAARLIAAGLMPLPGLKPDVTLQFHVAALLLHERPLEAEEIEAALAAQLAHMSPRTRRPIRFIAPEHPFASDAGQDSSLFAPDIRLDEPPPRSPPELRAVSRS